MLDADVRRLNFVIRYERLQEGFAEALLRLNLTPVRSFPVINKTQERRADWLSYYTPGIVQHAQRVFGPSMRCWGYDFPQQWEPRLPRLGDEIQYRTLLLLRQFYLTHLRYNSGFVGRTARRLRAALTT